MAKKTAQHIVNTDWTWDTESTSLPNEVITAGAVVEAARILSRVEALLRALVNRIDQLNSAGLSDVIREEAHFAKARRSRRLSRQRKARAARKART